MAQLDLSGTEVDGRFGFWGEGMPAQGTETLYPMVSEKIARGYIYGEIEVLREQKKLTLGTLLAIISRWARICMKEGDDNIYVQTSLLRLDIYTASTNKTPEEYANYVRNLAAIVYRDQLNTTITMVYPIHDFEEFFLKGLKFSGVPVGKLWRAYGDRWRNELRERPRCLQSIKDCLSHDDRQLWCFCRIVSYRMWYLFMKQAQIAAALIQSDMNVYSTQEREILTIENKKAPLFR